MPKYHINDKGNPGKCGVTTGTCPYGGDHQHYGSMESARAAFELSMAGEAAKSLKKSSAKAGSSPYPVEGDTVKVLKSAAVSNSSHGHYVGKTGEVVQFNGSSYTVKFSDGTLQNLNWSTVDFAEKTRASTATDSKELDFNETYGYSEDALIFSPEKQLASLKSLQPTRSDAELAAEVNRLKLAWENEARVEPAASYEASVPIRLIPVGSEVAAPRDNGGYSYHKVGVPADNGPIWDHEKNAPSKEHDIVGKYHDGIQWDYVGAETTFRTGRVPEGKGLSPRWNAVNKKAAALRAAREKVKSDLGLS